MRVRAGVPEAEGPPVLQKLAGPGAALPSESLEVDQIGGTGALVLPASEGFRSLTVVRGALTLDGLRLERGQTAALPARQGYELRLEGAWAVIARAKV